MCLLLTVVSGPQSYEDLQIVDRIQHSTFQAACNTQGLLKDDQEWSRYFTRAVLFSSERSLQTLFEVALIHGQVTDVLAL